MTSNGVNLDALIPREDFAADSTPARGTQSSTIDLGQLKEDSFFAQCLRKPDFQRETVHWAPQKIVDLVSAFLDGDLIPAIILWRSGQYVFVIDGAHRLSAILSWLYDDYGDRARSRAFFSNQIPDEQIKLAEQTRGLISQQVGTYASFKDAAKNVSYADGVLAERLGGLASNSFVAQWVPALNADGAEKSFFKINQSPTPVDPAEKRILKSRESAVAIATRVINRGGVGHKYWEKFQLSAQKEIENLGRDIYEALYLPPMGSAPIKTSDVPVGGRGYNALPFIFDLVSLANDMSQNEKHTADVSGDDTIRYLKSVWKNIKRVTTTDPGSLGLHPLVYFYTRGGTFQPIAFLAVMQFVRTLIDRKKLREFTGIRKEYEAFITKYKEAFTLIVKSQGAGARSLPALIGFLNLVFDGLVETKTEADLLAEISSDNRFRFLSTPAPVRGAKLDHGARKFSSSVKSATFVAELMENGVRCAICGALLHRNSMSTDHIARKAEGGSASSQNAQLTHPFCNSTYKEGGKA